ncbi:MAG: alpha/beta fold hydrolase [Actinomycetota bacterium]
MTARSLILVHGAGSGPWIWDGWEDAFGGLSITAIDLHRGRDVGAASMWDYEASIYQAAEVLPTPLALCGWSMGGLLAAMASRTLRPEAVVMLEPSPPAEVQGEDHDAPLERGTYDPEEVYGPFPEGMAPRPDSLLARAERKRGISIPSLPCRSLVIAGSAFPEVRGTRVAAHFGSELLELPDVDHWGLVLDPRVPLAVAGFLTA